MNTTETASTYWVCVSCYCASEGLLEPDVQTDKPPLSEIPEGAEVTAGLLWEEHDTPEECRQAFELAAGCECEHRTFSRVGCDGCGSTLAGTRDALTVWGAR